MSFYNKNGGIIVKSIINVIQENKQYLSDIDATIGDGDHGINMSKGMSIAEEKLKGTNYSMTEGLKAIQNALINNIGGSMGPLYGMLFGGFVEASEKEEIIDGSVIERMLEKAYLNLKTITDAKLGDKTIIDVLYPSIISYKENFAKTNNIIDALNAMKNTADESLNATKNMIAKIGRAARLGEKSRGYLDAGCASCCLILKAFADAVIKLERND